MDINFLKNHMQELNEQIKSILTESGYHNMENLTEIEWDQENPDNWMFCYKFSEVMYHLDHIHQILDYLEKPITHEGLVKFENAKFKLDGIELNEGQCVEILVRDEYTKKYVWKECYVKYPRDLHSLIKVGEKGRIRG